MFVLIAAALSLAAAEPTQGNTLATTPTEPAATAQQAAVAANASAKKKDELVCKSEAVLGTRFPKRVCRTREQIEARRREDQDVIQTLTLEKATFPVGG